MIGLDTTVLLTHEIKEAAGHESLRTYIATACRSGNILFAICPQVLQEFVHVATDPRRFKVPLTMDQALERSRFWWESAEVVQCHPGGHAWEQAWNWMELDGKIPPWPQTHSRYLPRRHLPRARHQSVGHREHNGFRGVRNF